MSRRMGASELEHGNAESKHLIVVNTQQAIRRARQAVAQLGLREGGRRRLSTTRLPDMSAHVQRVRKGDGGRDYVQLLRFAVKQCEGVAMLPCCMLDGGGGRRGAPFAQPGGM